MQLSCSVGNQRRPFLVRILYMFPFEATSICGTDKSRFQSLLNHSEFWLSYTDL